MAKLLRLRELLPEYYEDVYDMQVIMRVEQVVLDELQTEFEKQQANMFVLTADDDGISVWESMFGLNGVGQSLDNRRYAVLAQLLQPQPITIAYLNSVIKRLNINAYIQSVGSDYHVNLNMQGMNAESGQRLDDLLMRMLPANLTYTRINSQEFQTEGNAYIGTAHGVEVEIGGQ